MASVDESAAAGADTVEQLLALFEAARNAVMSALLATGRPLKVAQERVAVVPNEEGTGQRSETRIVETNVLELMIRLQVAEALGPWLNQARAVSAHLAATYPDHLLMPLVFPGASPDFVGLSLTDLDPGDPEQWTLAFIVIPAAIGYLMRLPSVDVADGVLAGRIAAEVVDVLSTGGLVARQAIAVAGVSPENDLIECGANRIRTLTALERGDLLDLRQPTRRSTYLGWVPESFWPTHVLEMDRPAGKPNEIGLLPVPKLLLALQLNGATLTGPGGLATYLLPEWLSSARMTKLIPMPRNPGSECLLSVAQFQAACATADRLATYRLDPPEGPSELALHRFGLGCSRSDAADGVLDFVVALEALLLPYDREVRYADLSYRFRLHGALFIADSTLERRTVFSTLRKLYEMRSRLVHGDKYPDPGEILTSAQEARQLAARGLLKAVSNGFPDVASFNRLALGESVEK